jgi:hypothetical protein
MRKFATKVVLITAAALIVVGVAAGATYRGIEPITIAGNPTCSNIPGLTFTSQVKFSSPVNGASGGGVYIFVDGNTVGWYTLGGYPLIKAVIVKGGSAANVYRYPAFDDYSDTSLLPPLNPKTGKVYSLGSVTFCY